jgi:hypothetical protein
MRHRALREAEWHCAVGVTRHQMSACVEHTEAGSRNETGILARFRRSNQSIQ